MERDGSEDVVDGGETVRNSVGRAPLGRSKMEVTTGWTEDDGREGVGHSLGGAPWGRGEMEATSKLDGGEIVGNSMGREGSDVRVDGGDRLGELRWEGDDVEATIGWTEGKPWEIGWGELGWEGGSEMEATGWTEGKPWEIAWGELRWEEATY